MGAKDEHKRRRHISFKSTVQDRRLLKFLDEKSKVYGLSNYIKILLQMAMSNEKENK
ncbi:MAG: hypothetical protein ACRCX2_33830 [Paraclostridium sp.]